MVGEVGPEGWGPGWEGPAGRLRACRQALRAAVAVAAAQPWPVTDQVVVAAGQGGGVAAGQAVVAAAQRAPAVARV